MKLRIYGDFILVGAFGIVAPVTLAPINRHWTVFLVSVAMFAMAVAFLRDGLRTLDNLHK